MHNSIQDSRLAPAYFSPNYKYFDQLLQTVKNETTVLNLVFKGFLQTSIPPLISIFYPIEGISRFSVENFLSHSAEKIRKGALLCFRKFLLSKNVKDKRGGGVVSRLSLEIVLSHSTKKIRRGTLWCFRKFWVSKNVMHKRGRGITILRRNFLSQCRNISLGNPSWFRKKSGIETFRAQEGWYHDFPS